MSATLNMNFSMPSRRAMQAESEMKMVLARCLGWLMRANIMPSVMAFSIAAQMDCKARIQADNQQSVGKRAP